jgi:hypothetical protein
VALSMLTVAQMCCWRSVRLSSPVLSEGHSGSAKLKDVRIVLADVKIHRDKLHDQSEMARHGGWWVLWANC